MIAELLSFSVFLLFLVLLFRKKWQNLPPSPLSLPIIGHLHLLGPLIHHSFHNISSRYGPLIYLKLGSVSCVVASTPELAKQLLKTHELVFSSRKHSLAIDHLTYNSSFAFSPYGPYWKFIKKISTFELLGNRMINQFLPIRNKELQHFIGDLNSRIGQSVNVTQELIKYSNNIISQMMLSMRSSDSDNDADIARIVVREVTKIFGEFNVSDFIWFCRNFDLQGFRNRIDEIYTNYDGLLEKLITNREQQRKRMNKSISNGEEANKDFLDIMLDVMEDENAEIRLTRNHIKALFLDFFTAATDTTAITIEWALAELINNPKVLEKAREEINKVVGNERIVKESDNSNLHYIEAILKETFRLHPPIPMVSRKSIQECKINRYTIPSNSLLFVNMWSIGRDPKYWKDPLEFKPERFLKSNNNNDDDHEANEFGDTSSVDIRGQHFQLLPFGTGRRSCPGISLAMQELPTTLGAMIQCFDWKLVNPPGVKINGGDYNVLDMTERPGLTAPRLHDLVLIPVPRMPHILDALSAT